MISTCISVSFVPSRKCESGRRTDPREDSKEHDMCRPELSDRRWSAFNQLLVSLGGVLYANNTDRPCYLQKEHHRRSDNVVCIKSGTVVRTFVSAMRTTDFADIMASGDVDHEDGRQTCARTPKFHSQTGSTTNHSAAALRPKTLTSSTLSLSPMPSGFSQIFASVGVHTSCVRNRTVMSLLGATRSAACALQKAFVGRNPVRAVMETSHGGVMRNEQHLT
jgi:hypothetical protein